jgi:hypothetical protein
MSYLVVIFFLLVLLEVKARKRFLKMHGVPYRYKKVGEYPYNKFIEECGPPLHWRLKSGYADSSMTINSLGLRSPEPQPGRPKVWVVGESEYFGAKLDDESRIWFRVLQARLDEFGYDYQVMNASIIGYNGQQAADFVSSLPVGEGDIVLLRANQNDVSIAYVNGEDWKPGMPWPLGFIHKQQRHKAWYLKLADRSCLGMYIRRRFTKGSGRAGAFAPKPGFQWENLLNYEVDQMQRIIGFSLERGAQVGLMDFASSYEAKISSEDEPKLSTIQSNWQGLVEGWSQYQFGIVEETYERLGKSIELPLLRTAPHIWEHPSRYQLYLDLLHFNADGHAAIAEALFVELEKEFFKGGV